MSSETGDLTQLRLEEFLDRVAERTPAPGGGSVAAAVATLAVSLARMVTAYSVSAKTEPAVRTRIEEAAARLRRADELLRTLVTEDAGAYTELAAVGKGAREGKCSTDQYRIAVMRALGVPLQLAALVGDVLDTLDSIKGMTNPRLLSDLHAAAIFAESAARAARCMVQVNLPELSDVEQRARFAADADQMLARCAARRGSIEAGLP